MRMQSNQQRTPYHVRGALGLAITQLVLGVLCIICGIVATVWRFTDRVPLARWTGGSDVWGPVFAVVAGILGIVAGCKGSCGLIVAHMVLSIISSVTSFILFGCSCFFPMVLGQVGPYIALAILSFIEFIISILSAVLCCRAVCCCRRRTQTGIVVNQQQQQQQAVIQTMVPTVNLFR